MYAYEWEIFEDKETRRGVGDNQRTDHLIMSQRVCIEYKSKMDCVMSNPILSDRKT